MNKALSVSTQPIHIYLPSKPLFARSYISCFEREGSFFLLALTQSTFAHLRRHYSLGLTLILVLLRTCRLFLLAFTLSTVAHLPRYHSLGLTLILNSASNVQALSVSTRSVELSSPWMTLPVRPCELLLFLSSLTQSLSAHLRRYYSLRLIFFF